MMVKDIIGYEGIYQIDEYGNVYKASDFKLMSPYISNKGYKIIDLYKDGIRSKFLVHRLVAIHFVPNPNNYPIVLHKDNVKLNTHYSNLIWGTYSQNTIQAIRDGLTPVPVPPCVDNRKFYAVFDENSEDFDICLGAKEVSELTGITVSMVKNYLHKGSPILKGSYAGYYIGIPRRV